MQYRKFIECVELFHDRLCSKFQQAVSVTTSGIVTHNVRWVSCSEHSKWPASLLMSCDPQYTPQFLVWGLTWKLIYWASLPGLYMWIVGIGHVQETVLTIWRRTKCLHNGNECCLKVLECCLNVPECCLNVPECCLGLTRSLALISWYTTGREYGVTISWLNCFS